MAENEDFRPLRSKRKAITALLPYAVWQERDGQPEMFNVILHAVRASKMSEFMWRYVGQSVGTLLSVASPRAFLLASPHTFWRSGCDENVVRQWVTAVSAVPYTEEVAQSVVEMLLVIVSSDKLSRYITADIWTWFTKHPSLPPVCSGRYVATKAYAIKAVRELKNTEILKLYFLLVWSEWNCVLEEPKPSSLWSLTHGISLSCPSSGNAPDYRLTESSHEVSCNFCLMQIAIQENFVGAWRKTHREDLVRHLDHVLTQLSRELEYFKQHDPETNADDLTRRWNQYTILRRTLLETDVWAGCMFHFNTNYAPLCANSYPGCSQNRARRVCVHTFSRARCLAPGMPNTPTPCFVRASTSVQHVVTFQGFLRLQILSTIHMLDSVSISLSFIYTFHLRLHMPHGSCFLLSSSSSIR